MINYLAKHAYDGANHPTKAHKEASFDAAERSQPHDEEEQWQERDNYRRQIGATQAASPPRPDPPAPPRDRPR